jgi:hypothetical protein
MNTRRKLKARQNREVSDRKQDSQANQTDLPQTDGQRISFLKKESNPKNSVV